MKDHLMSVLTYKSNEPCFGDGDYYLDESMHPIPDPNFMKLKIESFKGKKLNSFKDKILTLGETKRVILHFDKKLGNRFRVAVGFDQRYSFILEFQNSLVKLYIYNVVGRKSLNRIIKRL